MQVSRCLFVATLFGVLCLLTASNAQAQGELCTHYFSNNQFAGNMFDVEPKRDLTLGAIDLNLTADGADAQVQVFYREGGHAGFESDPQAWIELGSYTVVGRGAGRSTRVKLRPTSLRAGRTYGIYVHLQSYEVGVQGLRYLDGGPTRVENADLSLTTGVGKGYPAFSGQTLASREWNGCLHYAFGISGVELSLTGSCPGDMDCRVTGATPGGKVVLLGARDRGSYTIPGGRYCTGTVLGLDASATVRGVFQADASGVVLDRLQAPPKACGRYFMQALDLTTCELSTVEAM